jgi:hypothetical protein
MLADAADAHGQTIRDEDDAAHDFFRSFSLLPTV